LKPRLRQRLAKFIRNLPLLRRRAQDQAFGWARLAKGGVDVYFVPGNHDTMVEEPNVETVAARLRACLDQSGAAEPLATTDGAQPISIAAAV
jgi:thioesterase domain-containing protein